MRTALFTTLFGVFLLLAAGLLPSAAAQSGSHKSLEISEDDGRPVLFKHLPDGSADPSAARFFSDKDTLKSVFPDQAILDPIAFEGGTEAVSADYPEGRLLIVEFTTPQASSEFDAASLSALAASPQPSTVYRRVGNYNVFVFGAADPEAAAGLIDQVKYEKQVQWLGEDPFLLKKLERYFATTTRDIFISTVQWIVGGLGLSVLCGLVVGYLFFRHRERQRLTRTAFSDAGGMTRLNLDGFSD